MKNLKGIYFLLFSALMACGSGDFREPPTVIFGEPQPADIENLPAFPKRIQGQFRGLAEGNILNISDKLIISTSEFDEKMSIASLDSSATLIGDTLVEKSSGKKEKVLIQGDSLVRHFSYSDTVYRINFDNVLRKFKGHYFLNTRFEGENWDVKQLSLEGGKLVLCSIRTKEEIDNLQAITETEGDTSLPRKFNLSKKQFREFLGKDGFREKSVYIRENGLR